MSDVEFLKELQIQCLKDCEEHFEVFTETLRQISDEPLNAVRAILKICHNLKGNFQAVGFINLANFIHNIEDSLARTEEKIQKVADIPESDIQALEFLLAGVLNRLEFEIKQMEDFLTKDGGLLKDNLDVSKRYVEIELLLSWMQNDNSAVASVAPVPAPAAPAAVSESATAMFEAAMSEPAAAAPEQAANEQADLVSEPMPPVVAVSAQTVSVADTALVQQPIAASPKLKDELYLLCKNGAKYFAVSIANIVEIVCAQTLTPIPTPNKLLRGLLNLRGEVMPILDLGSTFDGRKSKSDGAGKAYIVIVRVGAHDFGFEIAEVHEVMPLKSESFQPLAAVDLASERGLVTHISLTDNKTILVLDLNRAMAAA